MGHRILYIIYDLKVVQNGCWLRAWPKTGYTGKSGFSGKTNYGKEKGRGLASREGLIM